VQAASSPDKRIEFRPSANCSSASTRVHHQRYRRPSSKQRPPQDVHGLSTERLLVYNQSFSGTPRWCYGYRVTLNISLQSLHPKECCLRYPAAPNALESNVLSCIHGTTQMCGRGRRNRISAPMNLVRNNARPPIICTCLEIQEKNAEAWGTGVDACSIVTIQKIR
jgi:hypothetical protein